MMSLPNPWYASHKERQCWKPYGYPKGPSKAWQVPAGARASSDEASEDFTSEDSGVSGSGKGSMDDPDEYKGGNSGSLEAPGKLWKGKGNSREEDEETTIDLPELTTESYDEDPEVGFPSQPC